jgi:hypothetical protein
MNDFPTEFYDNFKELFDEYVQVKKAIILLENLDKNHKIHIAPLNQLRSGLDHAFKASVVEGAQFKHEIIEMREHIRRAGYDAFELLASILGLTIVNKLKWVSNKALETVFPEYYTTISSQLINIQVRLAEIRTDKNHFESPFTQYMKEITSIIEIYKKVQSKIPVLREYDRKRIFGKIVSIIISIGVGVIIGLLIS